jgi:hypothetical protein
MSVYRGVVLVILSVFSLGVCAGEPTQAQKDELCEAVHGAAENVMRARQGGVPMPKMMEMASKAAGGRELVVAAYREPMFSSDSYIERAVVKFANEAYLACITAWDAN